VPETTIPNKENEDIQVNREDMVSGIREGLDSVTAPAASAKAAQNAPSASETAPDQRIQPAIPSREKISGKIFRTRRNVRRGAWPRAGQVEKSTAKYDLPRQKTDAAPILLHVPAIDFVVDEKAEAHREIATAAHLNSASAATAADARALGGQVVRKRWSWGQNQES
jgi:hypothetical protein